MSRVTSAAAIYLCMFLCFYIDRVITALQYDLRTIGILEGIYLYCIHMNMACENGKNKCLTNTDKHSMLCALGGILTLWFQLKYNYTYI